MLPIGQGQEFLPTAIAKRHLDIPVLLTLSPVYSCPSHLDKPAHPGSATVAVPGTTEDKTPAKSLRVFENPKYAMARRIFLVPQLISFWELSQAKSRQVQKPPCRPQPQHKPLLQRESSRHSRPPTAGAEAHRGRAKPKSTDSRAPSPPENKALHSRPWARRQPCPEPLPERRRMRQCKPMSNTAPRASCSQGYHGPCTARRNPQRYLCGLLGYPHPFLRERGLPYCPKSERDGTSGNHSQRIRHRQLLGTGMVSPTYAYAAPISHQGPVGNYRNTRDKRIHAQKNPNIRQNSTAPHSSF